MLTTGNIKFVSAKAIDCKEPFVQIELQMELEDGSWMETDREVGINLTWSEAMRMATRIKAAHNPVAYINAIIEKDAPAWELKRLEADRTMGLR